MSADLEQQQVTDLAFEQKNSNDVQGDNASVTTPLLMEESKSNPLPARTDHLKVKLNLHSNYSNRSDDKSSKQPRTPVENLLSNIDSCTLFTPNKKRSGSGDQQMMSLISYPSNLEPIDDKQQEPKQIETITSDWVITRYYPTTSCSILFFRILRFIRMACFILPIVSMVGSLFTHTSYVKLIIDTTAKLWALIPGIESNSPLADTFGVVTTSIITLVIMILVFRFLWARLIKKKFLDTYNLGFIKVKSAVKNATSNRPHFFSELKALGIIGENKSNSMLAKPEVDTKTLQDCYLLYFKYSILAQHYNTDRMGPYDIAKERLASQFRIYCIFLFLVPAIDRQSDPQHNTFNGQKINYEKVYTILIGALADAQKKSDANHKKSKCFSCLKKNVTQSHYALMLKRLLADEYNSKDDETLSNNSKTDLNDAELGSDDNKSDSNDNESSLNNNGDSVNDDAISIYKESLKKSSLFDGLITGAEAESGFTGYQDDSEAPTPQPKF